VHCVALLPLRPLVVHYKLVCTNACTYYIILFTTAQITSLDALETGFYYEVFVEGQDAPVHTDPGKIGH
jgi:hypothetical protein